MQAGLLSALMVTLYRGLTDRGFYIPTFRGSQILLQNYDVPNSYNPIGRSLAGPDALKLEI